MSPVPSFLATVRDPHSVITPLSGGLLFPEILSVMREKYEPAIREFAELVASSSSSAELLERIRTPKISAERRIALLKLFRRCVASAADTETTRKIHRHTTKSLIVNYGRTFKSITKLKEQFALLNDAVISALAMSMGENDFRGQSGYELTGRFFDWFEAKFAGQLIIDGPRGAGSDIELCSVIPAFTGACPCDFVIRNRGKADVIAVGFARYDSTRGGSQSDDRTGGNTAKVYMIREFCKPPTKPLRIIFLADGPGLAHGDTWAEAVKLDGSWEDNVRVTTLKLADQRITLKWLRFEG